MFETLTTTDFFVSKFAQKATPPWKEGGTPLSSKGSSFSKFPQDVVSFQNLPERKTSKIMVRLPKSFL